MKGHRGTKPGFYQASGAPIWTGRDRKRHPVAVRLRSEGDLVLFGTYLEGVAAERCRNRIATRYEKRAVNYRAAVVIAALMIWLAS